MAYCLSVRGRKLSITPFRDPARNFSYNEKSRETLIRTKEYNGYMSRSTRKKVSNIIITLIDAVRLHKDRFGTHQISRKYHSTFCTLTLSTKQKHDDNYIKRNMLMRFLDRLRDEDKISNYIWKAEKQKNGNIHFHIIFDRYVLHTTIRKYWNDIQERCGYIDDFYNKFKHRDPNSTDIHSIKKLRSTESYLCSYFVKDLKTKKVEGRIWGCNAELHKLKACSSEMSWKEEDILKEYTIRKDTRMITGDYFTVVYVNDIEELREKVNFAYLWYQDYLRNIINFKI